MTPPRPEQLDRWSWRALGAPAESPPRLSIRTKALIQAPLMGLAGFLSWRFLDHRVIPVALWTLAVAVLTGGWCAPPLFHAVERFGRFLATAVIAVLNTVLLVPFFFLCCVPGRLILLARGIDPMNRAFPSGRDSLWIDRGPAPPPGQYRKQH